MQSSRAKIGFAIGLAVIAILMGRRVLQLFEMHPQVVISSGITDFPPSPAVNFKQERIGPKGDQPRITNVQIVDLDADQRNEILVCDGAQNAVFLYRQNTAGAWEEMLVANGLRVPAHATPADVDADGDQDIVVAVLGDSLPSDELVGQVVLLEKTESGFQKHILLDDVRRVADVQAGDFDGDGDVDLAVAVFGYARGEVLWLENRGQHQFRDHLLLSRPGVIHVPVADYDLDGDLDIATVVSQDEEEVWGLENDGQGAFQARRLFFTHNFDAGSGGLVKCDLDQDGDEDFLLPWGDNLEYGHSWPQPYHGCLWLRNDGDWQFNVERIGTFGGAYAAAPGDLDADGDLDVVLVSMSNDWSDPTHESIVWLENDGQQSFQTWEIDTSPVELITVACGDLDADGRDDVVAGSLHLPASSVKRVQRVTSWLTKGISP